MIKQLAYVLMEEFGITMTEALEIAGEEIAQHGASAFADD